MSITQEMRFRESLMKFTEKHGVQQAMRKYNKSKSYIYFWRVRWLAGDKNIESLRECSRRPDSSPRQHTQDEEKLIKDLCRRNPNIGEVDLWYKLRSRGYTRSLSGLSKALHRLGIRTSPKSRPSPSYKPKPYEQMTFPGERVQIDVKYVPKECLSPELTEVASYTKFYQYTAIDEYCRVRFLMGFDEHNTYSSSVFLRRVYQYYKKLGVEIKCVQTDNGAEFTKRLMSVKSEVEESSLFALTAKELGIEVRHIKPHTPRHNGKVERSHREDQKLFYSPIMEEDSKRKFSSLDDFNKKLQRHMFRTNRRPMRPLGFLSPLAYLRKFQGK